MSSYSLALDIAALALIAGCALFYAYRGFVAGLFGFLGTLIALVLASVAAYALSPHIFDLFFRSGLEKQVAEAIQQQGLYSAQELLGGLLAFLPQKMVDSIIAALDPSLDFNAQDIAFQVVEQVLKPVVLPLISTIVFILTFSIARVLVGVARRLAMGVARLPVVSLVNKMMGAGMGVLIGILYVFIGMVILWAFDRFYPSEAMGQIYFSKSIVYQLFSGLNFFSRL